MRTRQIILYQVVATLRRPQINKTLAKRGGIQNQNKKEEIWPSPMTKAPSPTEMSKGQSDNTKNAKKKFD